MSRLHITDQAETDLAEIWLFVAEDNPTAADRLAATIVEKYQVLAHQPRLGRSATT